MSASACRVRRPEQASGTLRVGVIGLGVGMAHAEAVAGRSDARLLRVCDLDPTRLAEAATRFRGVECSERPEDVQSADDLDVVVVASFDDFHAEQVLAALRCNKHVFVEKPLCLRRAEAERICNELRDRPGLRLSSNLILRASPRFVDLRARIVGGELGELFSLDGQYEYGRLHKLTDGWRGRTPGYSVTLGGAIHLIDLMQWLANDRIVEVSAFGTAIAGRGSPFAGDDEIAAVVRFAGGAVGRVGASYGCVRPHFHGLTVRGTRGTFVNDLPDARLYTARDALAAPALIRTAYPGVHKGALLDAFLGELSGNERGAAHRAVSAEDSFHALAVAFAIDESVASGESRIVRPVEPTLVAAGERSERP